MTPTPHHERSNDLTMEQPVSVTLPYPPPANKLWVPRKNGRRMMLTDSDIYTAYKAEAFVACISQGFIGTGGTIPFQNGERLSVSLDVYRPRRSGDLDNSCKPCLDALNGRLWTDDSQIEQIHLYRHDRKNDGGVVVTVRALEDLNK